MDSLLTVQDLAQILRKSIHSVRHDVNRNPRSLPPRVVLPGTQRLLWRSHDVEAWIASHIDASQTVPVAQSAAHLAEPPPRRKRGRPSKAEQIAHAHREGGEK